MSFRDRFFTPKVARAITDPMAILATGAGAALGVLALGNPLGALVGGAALLAARVGLAIPRGGPRKDRIDPYTLDEPWRQHMRDALAAKTRFLDAADRAEGGVHDTLATIGDHIDTGVDQAWKVALGGQQLQVARREIDTRPTQADLARLRQRITTEGTNPTLEQTATALEAQLASADRLGRTINDTENRLGLLVARLEEAATRAIELSVSQADSAALGALGADVDGILGEMEALRQAVEVVERIGSTEAEPLPDLDAIARGSAAQTPIRQQTPAQQQAPAPAPAPAPPLAQPQTWPPQEPDGTGTRA